MRHNIPKLLVLFLLIILCACEQKAPTWQEQYDLGVRYLSEGNYEEAIIAFTAAIEIDPKQAPAYVGRGDAYVLSGETENNLAAAQVDYEKAIELDNTITDAYLSLADVYIRQENYDKALEILRRGLEKTEEYFIKEKLDEIEKIMKDQIPLKDADTVAHSERVDDEYGYWIYDYNANNQLLQETLYNLDDSIRMVQKYHYNNEIL